MSSRTMPGQWLTARTGTVALVALASLLALPLVVRAQDRAADQRRQLEVFEDLLTQTVHQYVTQQVNAAVEAERVRDLDGDGEPDLAPDPLVVKIGAAAPAHGVVIAGYGVIFSIQTPQLAVIPQNFEARLSQPLAVLQFGVGSGDRAGEGNLRRIGGGVIEFQAAMIQQQLHGLESLLERELEREGDPESTQGMLRRIEELRQQLSELGMEVSESTGAEPEVAAAEAPAAEARPEGEARQRANDMVERARGMQRSYYRTVIDRQRSMREILQRNLSSMTAAVNDAAIMTLANYGSVLKGMDSDDRVSVLVFPPTQWSLASEHGVGVGREEYVISVRYRDIRDYDNQKIDLEEFRNRVRLHSRLGTEMAEEER